MTVLDAVSSEGFAFSLGLLLVWLNIYGKFFLELLSIIMNCTRTTFQMSPNEMLQTSLSLIIIFYFFFFSTVINKGILFPVFLLMGSAVPNHTFIINYILLSKITSLIALDCHLTFYECVNGP